MTDADNRLTRRTLFIGAAASLICAPAVDSNEVESASATREVSHDRMHEGRANAPVRAHNGKYDSDQVRNIVLEVTNNPNLGRDATLRVLDQVGDGIKSLSSLKPENFDKVYEACQSLLAGRGASANAVKPHVK
jgi:hypothetical protein